ncbi:MAG: methylated-DNA--[protein]-cysteine S-methyltransferase [Alistipes sp.]
MLSAHDQIITCSYSAPCGELLLGAFGYRLCMCDWHIGRRSEITGRRLQKGLNARFVHGECELLADAVRQLDEYFAGRRCAFDMPLLLVGSEFQKAVWNALLGIPFGVTVSYGELARRMGRASAVRAVANANGANALSLFVPCHRVIGCNGALTGYAGGVDAKRYLLALEQSSLFG